VIDGDSESLSLLLSNTSSLELPESETSSLSDLGVVPDGGASDGGSESLEGSSSEGGGLGGSSLSSSRLSSRLVEPGLHSSLEELMVVVEERMTMRMRVVRQEEEVEERKDWTSGRRDGEVGGRREGERRDL